MDERVYFWYTTCVMNTYIKRFRLLPRKTRYIAYGAVIFVVGAVLYAVWGGDSAPDTALTVARGSISEVVSVTGRVKPSQDVELSFQSSGRIARVPAVVGQRVVIGQVLASLDLGELSADLQDAQANVLSQEAKLRELEAGSRVEEIEIKESDLRRAQRDLDNAYANVYDVLYDAYTKTDNAIRVQLAAMFDNFGTEATPLYRLTFTCVCDDYKTSNAAKYRTAVESDLDRWQEELNGLSVSPTDAMYTTALSNARRYLQSARDTITAMGAVLDDPGAVLSSTVVQEYRTNVSAGRSSVVAAITSVNTQDQLISTVTFAVERAASDLALTKAGSTPDEIDAQRAALMSAQAKAQRIGSLIAKGIIRSPIVGIVTRQDAKVGQTATANQALVAVISDRQLEIEANVPEVDVGKISVDDVVRMTVDALPGDTFTARVAFIDPAETIIDGVVNFKVKIVFDVVDERLKSGLTANLNIESYRKDDVLILPQYAILENDEGTFVRKISGADIAEIPVTLGIRGANGDVEIVSGLSEGDRVQNIGLKD